MNLSKSIKPGASVCCCCGAHAWEKITTENVNLTRGLLFSMKPPPSLEGVGYPLEHTVVSIPLGDETLYVVESRIK